MSSIGNWAGLMRLCGVVGQESKAFGQALLNEYHRQEKEGLTNGDKTLYGGAAGNTKQITLVEGTWQLRRIDWVKHPPKRLLQDVCKILGVDFTPGNCDILCGILYESWVASPIKIRRRRRFTQKKKQPRKRRANGHRHHQCHIR